MTKHNLRFILFRMKTISFFNFKGGTGKTTMNLLLAGELIDNGKKVIVIDADPQGNASGIFCNKETDEKELVDYLNSQSKISEIIHETDYENLHIIPTFSFGKLSNFINTQSGLTEYRDIVDILIEELDRNYDYDFCLVDLSPSYNELQKKFVVASNEVIPVLDMGGFALEGYTELLNTIVRLRGRHSEPIVNKTIFNKKESTLKSHKEREAAIKESIASDSMQVFVFPKNSVLSDAPDTKSLATDYKLRDVVREPLKALVSALIGA